MARASNATDKYKFVIELKYMMVDRKEYYTIDGKFINYCLIDRDYDNNNMPTIYVAMSVPRKIYDNMKANDKKNLINIEVYKYRYDDDNYIPEIDELYFRDQCTYFVTEASTDTDSNELKDTEFYDNGDGTVDEYSDIEIGLMKIDQINYNKQKFSGTFVENTTLTSVVSTVLQNIPDVVMEPLSYPTELLDGLSIEQDSVSTTIKALNDLKALYNSNYRLFFDFDALYLLSSNGYEVPKEGENISGVLVCIKKEEDYLGMDDGVYTNRSGGNYQINVRESSTNIYTDQLIDKVYDNVVAITGSGDRLQVDLKIDKSDFSLSKTKTIYIPNDNAASIDGIKTGIESSTVLMTLCKESIDPDVFTINHRICVKHIDDHKDKDGDYLMTRKREIFVRDGRDFICSTMVNLRKIRDTQFSRNSDNSNGILSTGGDDDYYDDDDYTSDESDLRPVKAADSPTVGNVTVDTSRDGSTTAVYVDKGKTTLDTFAEATPVIVQGSSGFNTDLTKSILARRMNAIANCN